jgi:uncharacterized membrane protein YfcA
MMGRLAMYVANRATGGAVDGLTRRATWGAAGAAFCICASIFALVAIYWFLSDQFGPIMAASIVAIASLFVGVVCLFAPSVIEWSEKKAVEQASAGKSTLTATVETVNKETAAAVDYFGPLQVIASAFLVGMRTGQQLKRSRSVAS